MGSQCSGEGGTQGEGELCGVDMPIRIYKNILVNLFSDHQTSA